MKVGFASTMQLQLTRFDIIVTWRFLLSSRDVEPMMKMCFIALGILLMRRKFGSRYGVLITHIFSASQPLKHGYKRCLRNLLVTCF